MVDSVDKAACALSKSELSSPSSASGATEPSPTWYDREGWRFGSLKLHVVVSLFYLMVALFPLVQYVYSNYTIPSWVNAHPMVVLLWAAFVALAYPLWTWQETRVFERWVRQFAEDKRKAERAYFVLQSALAKNFWAAVLAIYTVAGLLGIALKASVK